MPQNPRGFFKYILEETTNATTNSHRSAKNTEGDSNKEMWIWHTFIGFKRRAAFSSITFLGLKLNVFEFKCLKHFKDGLLPIFDQMSVKYMIELSKFSSLRQG